MCLSLKAEVARLNEQWGPNSAVQVGFAFLPLAAEPAAEYQRAPHCGLCPGFPTGLKHMNQTVGRVTSILANVVPDSWVHSPVFRFQGCCFALCVPTPEDGVGGVSPPLPHTCTHSGRPCPRSTADQPSLSSLLRYWWYSSGRSGTSYPSAFNLSSLVYRCLFKPTAVCIVLMLTVNKSRPF